MYNIGLDNLKSYLELILNYLGNLKRNVTNSKQK